MDIFDMMNEAYIDIKDDGVKYTDALKKGTKHQTVAFIKRGDKLFFESGMEITGGEAHSIKGRLDLGFYTPMNN